MSPPRDEIVITKHGKPLARLVPYVDLTDSLFGMHSDVLQIRDDIIEPLEDGWESE